MIMTPLLFTMTLGVSFLPPYISLAADATATEIYAASELHEQLAKACPGVNFTIGKPLPLTAQIVVGPGAAAALGVSLPSNLEGNESYVIDTTGEMVQASVVLAGGIGSARGTLYAIYQLLELLGWRFYAADETRVPALCPATSLVPPHKNVAHLPFEYRDNNQWAPAHNLTFAVRSGYNGHAPADRGDAVAYATPPGFVHTSYALLYYPEKSSNVPPPDLFAKHPEWFWPKASQGGATAYGQLCWSNSSLIKYLTAQVRAILAAEPDSMILSVSQNDNYNRCRTDAEERINDAEGSPMGALLRAVNTIADAVKDDWPHVAIDTLAYQWSRPATKLTRPRPNVIVRLCTIECDFGRPLTHPHNAPFQRDMEAWARISNRTWIWNYVRQPVSIPRPLACESPCIPALVPSVAAANPDVAGSTSASAGDQLPKLLLAVSRLVGADREYPLLPRAWRHRHLRRGHVHLSRGGSVRAHGLCHGGGDAQRQHRWARGHPRVCRGLLRPRWGVGNHALHADDAWGHPVVRLLHALLL
jgi:hypothetical protein